MIAHRSWWNKEKMLTDHGEAIPLDSGSAFGLDTRKLHKGRDWVGYQ